MKKLLTFLNLFVLYFSLITGEKKENKKDYFQIQFIFNYETCLENSLRIMFVKKDFLSEHRLYFEDSFNDEFRLDFDYCQIILNLCILDFDDLLKFSHNIETRPIKIENGYLYQISVHQMDEDLIFESNIIYIKYCQSQKKYILVKKIKL